MAINSSDSFFGQIGISFFSCSDKKVWLRLIEETQPSLRQVELNIPYLCQIVRYNFWFLPENIFERENADVFQNPQRSRFQFNFMVAVTHQILPRLKSIIE